MKIYILTDLEGATGIFRFNQVNMQTPEGIANMSWLMGDIAAVVKGLRAGGATEILVLDGHNGGNNFIPAEMVPGARYITGQPKPNGLYGLDSTFAGIILLGTHSMNGTAGGLLHHTQNEITEAKYFYDGIERGEIYQGSVHAGHYDVPVIMVSGDEAACAEARELLDPDLPVAAVKKGISREAGVLLPPAEARELLTATASKAIADIGRRKPYKPNFPIKLVVKRLGPNPTDLDNPWVVETEAIVHQGTNIIRGTPVQ